MAVCSGAHSRHVDTHGEAGTPGPHVVRAVGVELAIEIETWQTEA